MRPDLITTSIAAACLTTWAYLLVARGRFWMASVRDSAKMPAPPVWPAVTAVIPARNEVDCIASAVRSLLQQDYEGPLSIIVVDDDSSDGTGTIVTRLAADAPAGRTVEVLTSLGPPRGWTGKLAALNAGLARAAQAGQPQYVLLTDADIAHAPDTLTWLVTQARAGGRVLISLMAKLRCESLAERSHVPAFIYFFEMLYPFRWVNALRSRTAAAAGGCMLVERAALNAIGGIASIRGALIDDCALARALKAQGPIWLGLTERVRSLRAYERFADVKAMVSRSAYAQLGYSPSMLALTVAGMLFVFVAPVLLTFFAEGLPRWLGVASWLLMTTSFVPILRFYRLSVLWAAALPGTALLYTMYTLSSAWQHLRRRGGQWKGRVYAGAPSAR